MFRRPRRGALGLRGRIVGAVVVTTCATLAVAALALLGPLEQSLRSAALKTLQQDMRYGTIKQFKRLDLRFVLDASGFGKHDTEKSTGQSQLANLNALEQSIGNRIGAQITMFGYFDEQGRAVPLTAASIRTHSPTFARPSSPAGRSRASAPTAARSTRAWRSPPLFVASGS